MSRAHDHVDERESTRNAGLPALLDAFEAIQHFGYKPSKQSFAYPKKEHHSNHAGRQEGRKARMHAGG